MSAYDKYPCYDCGLFQCICGSGYKTPIETPATPPITELLLDKSDYDEDLDQGSDHTPLPTQMEKVGLALSRYFGNHDILVPNNVFLNELSSEVLYNTKILNKDWLELRRSEFKLRHDFA